MSWIQGIAFAGVTTRAEGVRVTGKLGFSAHPMIDHFRFVQAHTTRTPKITIPAPSAMYGRPVRNPINETAYPNLDLLFEDLGKAYRKGVRAFADAGCRYLQLDEVFIAMLCDPRYRQQMKDRGDDPEKLGDAYGEMINVAMSDIPSDMTITMHLCRGNYKSTFMGAGGYDAMQEILFNKINVHGYFMEYDDERSGSFEPLRLLPKGKQVVLGLVTTKSGKLESKDELKRRIDQAAKYADLDQLCLSGQCGFASTEEGNTLTEDEQWAKLAPHRRGRARGLGVGARVNRSAPRGTVADAGSETATPAHAGDVPERRPWKHAAYALVGLGTFFLISYPMANWLASLRAHVGSIVFGWEQHIPFIAWSIVPYCSIDVLYVISPFVCATRAELGTHVRRLLTTQIIAVSCFILFPLRFTFARPETEGVPGLLFDALGGFDLPYNQAPSLHIALLVILWEFYLRHVPR